MWWLVSLVTFFVFIPLFLAETFVAIVAANGFMGNTDPLAYSYLACQGGGLLFLSLLSGLLAKALKKTFSLPLWLGGMVTIILAVIAQVAFSFAAFLAAVTFFAP